MKESLSNEIDRQAKQRHDLEVLEGQAYEVYGQDEKKADKKFTPT